MYIQVVNSVNFTSRNRPIKAFNIKVNNEVLNFREIDYNQKPEENFLKAIASFFLDNFAKQSAHPYWKRCRKGTPFFDKKEYDNYIKNLISDCNGIIPDPNTTIMYGKDSKGKICASIVTNKLNLPNQINNNRILYLNSLAVGEDYRKNHIAKKLVNDVIESSKGQFDEVFLVAYNESVPFYTKQGFQTTKDSELIKHFAQKRKDYPEFASFLSKKI